MLKKKNFNCWYTPVLIDINLPASSQNNHGEIELFY